MGLDDIASLLASVSPEQMEKIKGIASSLMPPQTDNENANTQLPSNVTAILQSFNSSDDKTQLIRSLKPFLSPERQQRADEAMRLLKLMKILPLIGQLNINDLPV